MSPIACYSSKPCKGFHMTNPLTTKMGKLGFYYQFYYVMEFSKGQIPPATPMKIPSANHKAIGQIIQENIYYFVTKLLMIYKTFVANSIDKYGSIFLPKLAIELLMTLQIRLFKFKILTKLVMDFEMVFCKFSLV